MSKERSSRRALIKKKVTRSKEKAWGDGQDADVRLISETREGYREQARSQVLAAWPKILQGLIEKAMSGGYQHTKLLLDLCELATKESHNSNEHTGEQLCDVLLNNLRLRPPE